MTKKLDTILEQYQENVYPAMLEDLATHLGVSYESLAQLELGWAPIVKFKKGANYQGWWAVPERNEKGEVVGIGLRSQNDMKVMAPLGCHRGMIYSINPEHTQGSQVSEYRAGPKNWTRTMQEGIMCPVCGKPDGCLVSSEDVNDPQAVICIRESEGAKKTVRGGGSWLHILKESGDINKHAPLLPPSEHPVLVVEGMTDAAAGLDLGFVTVGRPNANSGLLELAELLRGRKVIVVGENDLKPDGSCPGRDGMLATAQVLRRTCKDVLKVMPPSDCKDLRTWLSKYKLTQVEFLTFAEDRGDRSVNLVVLPDDQPRTAGLAYLDEMFKLGERYTLRKWKGNTYYQYARSKYAEAEEVDVSGPMYDWAVGKSHMTLDKNGQPQIKPIKADRKYVGNVMAAVHNTIMLDPKATTPPSWINGVIGPEAHTLIPFSNGILDVDKYIAGESCLMDNSPDYFNLIALPYAFDETATCPIWTQFTDEAVGDDPDKLSLLREWYGYCMTFDNQFQKFMILRGVRQSGKSTILNVLRALVGEDQYMGTKFDSLQQQFGLEQAIGKLVCGIDEAQITRKTDVQAVMDVIRTVSGNAPTGVTRKYKQDVTLPLRARFTLTCNETPYLPDNADAMARRMLLIEFENEKQIPDPQLLSKLEKEIPGIAIWALQGLRSLHARKLDGYSQGFTVPKSMKQGLESWREFANPVGTFYEECCDHDPGFDTPTNAMMEVFNAWCVERNIKAPTLPRFTERLKFTAPADVNKENRTDPNSQRPYKVFTNINIKPWAVDVYLQGD